MSSDRRPTSDVRRPQNGGTQGRIDRAIDGAVREMLDAGPRAGFQTRVMRRISDADRVASGHQVASGFSRKILWFGAPVAAAAIVVLAVLLPSRTVEPPSHPAPVVARVDPPPAPVTLRPPVIDPERDATARPAAAVANPPRPAAPERTVAAATVDTATSIQIEPLAAITPIEVAPVAGYQVALSQISVRPLNPIAELQIAPLRPHERD